MNFRLPELTTPRFIGGEWEDVSTSLPKQLTREWNVVVFVNTKRGEFKFLVPKSEGPAIEILYDLHFVVKGVLPAMRAGSEYFYQGGRPPTRPVPR